ncbi:MAG: TrmH family RNA methyltransferase [Myxococcota bacterium]
MKPAAAVEASPEAESTQGRQRLLGCPRVRTALEEKERLQCVIIPREDVSPGARQLADRAEAEGIEILQVGARRFERLRGNHSDADILALAGPGADAPMAEVMARGGAVWLLTGPAYPGNVGFAIRTAEVSGADGLYVDNDFDHQGRLEARRAAMRADRFMPVGWACDDEVLSAARAVGKRLVAVEDVGRSAPWEVDLCGSLLIVVGAEAEGVPQAVLSRCDEVVRIPMAGFVASYNLQAAVASIASERFRQQQGGPRS